MTDRRFYPAASVVAWRRGACGDRWHGYLPACPELERCPTCLSAHVIMDGVEAYDGPGAPAPKPPATRVSPLSVRRVLDI